MVLAWHIEALHRQKRLPHLKDLIGKPKRRKRQNAADQMEVFGMWNVVMGGETVN